MIHSQKANDAILTDSRRLPGPERAQPGPPRRCCSPSWAPVPGDFGRDRCSARPYRGEELRVPAARCSSGAAGYVPRLRSRWVCPPLTTFRVHLRKPHRPLAQLVQKDPLKMTERKAQASLSRSRGRQEQCSTLQNAPEVLRTEAAAPLSAGRGNMILHSKAATQDTSQSRGLMCQRLGAQQIGAQHGSTSQPGPSAAGDWPPFLRFSLPSIHVKPCWEPLLETPRLPLRGAPGQPVQMSKAPPQAPGTEANGVSVIYSQAHGSGLQQVPQLVPASPAGGGKAVPPSRQGKKGCLVDRSSEEYRQRRERNNMAVKKSRLKSKQRAQDTLQRVTQLKEENERLEAKIKLLTKELSVLKDLFLEHAHNLADNVQPAGAEPPGASPDSSGQ
ncbi:CCAAT/enhancer-binding protein gamma [Melanerpes formicivorus]|uniref:CCAAT/enhancer-binding protein gamma n=1 Tax=Melanerpes formicivorus TaxID=211600 RepID=UPI00358E4471